jgi:hypothetical protein
MLTIRQSNLRDVLIIRLWNAGMTASQIAERVGVELGVPQTKNAIISRSRRLPACGRRASPIKGPPLTEDQRIEKQRERNAKRAKTVEARIKTAYARQVAIPVVAPQELTATAPILSNRPCAWPISDDRPFTFCGQPAIRGRSYCPSHQARATKR